MAAEKDIPVVSPEAEAMSEDLRKRGFKFVGPTICYAFMQAVGMVNDHLVGCFRYHEVQPRDEATALSGESRSRGRGGEPGHFDSRVRDT